MAAAIQEFNSQGYFKTSLNRICKYGQFSKGIVYHYFENKDQLYLACVNECFSLLTHWLKVHINHEICDIDTAITNYLNQRFAFFQRFPQYSKIFYDNMVDPILHLKSEIEKIKADFNFLSITIIKRIIKSSQLRSDLDLDLAIEAFQIFQNNTYIRFQQKKEANLQEYEDYCYFMLKIFFYGILK